MRVVRLRPRYPRGSFIVDLPSTLWVLLILITFPLLDLATVSLRYTFLVASARDAAHEAARAKSFLSNSSSSDLSSTNMAVQQANQTAAGFSGIQINNVNTSIVISNLATGTVSKQSTPLTQAPDTSQNLYLIEVVVAGQANPLIQYSGVFFGNIPGLTQPMNVTVASQEMCENPQGLTQ